MEHEYITVSVLNSHIKRLINSDSNLKRVYVRGELSNIRRYPNGHMYFTLKDKNSEIGGLMFRNYVSRLRFEPKNGMKVLVSGTVDVYPKQGSYKVYAHKITEDGIGDLYIAYEQLKKELSELGWFDKDHKKEIPRFPKRVGVVTASTGAAIRDIVTTIKRRWPLCEILLFPALVQGELAHETIVEQIKNADNYNLDTLIVGRGGGSIEDLWPFNEEDVARAIYNCNTPIISAVGHEVDFTIADFVADLRAPTPTGAAEMAVPQRNEVISLINQINIRLNKALINKININKKHLEEIKKHYIFTNPISIYQAKEMSFDAILERLKYSLTNLIHIKEKNYQKVTSSIVLQNPEILFDKKKNKYINILSKLETLSPLKTLQRGYSITKKDNKVITSIKNIKKGDNIKIEFNDGNIDAKVI